MGYLKRFAESKYRIIYDVLPVKGKRRQKRETLEGVSKKQAEAILAKRKMEIATQWKALDYGDQVKDEDTLSTLFDGFLKQKRTQKEETTIRRYETLVRLYLEPKFGDMKAKHLKPHHLMAAYSDGWRVVLRGASYQLRRFATYMSSCGTSLTGEFGVMF